MKDSVRLKTMREFYEFYHLYEKNSKQSWAVFHPVINRLHVWLTRKFQGKLWQILRVQVHLQGLLNWKNVSHQRKWLCRSIVIITYAVWWVYMQPNKNYLWWLFLETSKPSVFCHSRKCLEKA